MTRAEMESLVYDMHRGLAGSKKRGRDAIVRLFDETQRLMEICRNAHDRILRGDSDQELLDFLSEAWKAPSDTGISPRVSGHVE